MADILRKSPKGKDTKKPVEPDRDILEVLEEVPDATIAAAVQMLLLFFGRDPALAAALRRVDTVEEIQAVRALFRQVLGLVVK